MPDIGPRLQTAAEATRRHFGRRIRFYLPGMFTLNGLTGSYPALSITAGRCALDCDHCQGKILAAMIPAVTPGVLVERCTRLWGRGRQGVLVSGGCDREGALPWRAYADAIGTVKRTTGLIVSVHSGLIDGENARRLREAGVDQALIDVIGDDATLRRVCHLPGGVGRIAASIDALNRAGLPVVPHIVCGLDHGRIVGERRAIDMLTRFDIQQLVFVVLMPLRGTRGARVRPPAAEEVAELIAEARLRLVRTRLALGCARPRGDRRLEKLAIDAGINRLALPSDAAIAHARSRGLDISYQRTCCSVAQDLSAAHWPQEEKGNPDAR